MLKRYDFKIGQVIRAFRDVEIRSYEDIKNIQQEIRYLVKEQKKLDDRIDELVGKLARRFEIL